MQLPERNKRIQELINTYSKGNVADFVRLTGISSHQVLNRILKIDSRSGKYPKPSSDILTNIQKSLREVNPDWLLFGTGEMLINQRSLSDTKYNKPQVPYYNVDFIGGFDVIVNSQTSIPDGYIALPKFGKIDCWVDISGKSMEPLISSGDIIALRQVNDWRNNILYGEVYAIVTAEYRTVKRLRKGSSCDTIKLVPENPEYDAQEIPLESINFVYQVMGCTKKMF